MNKTERHQVRDAIDRALSQLRGIPVALPPEIDHLITEAEAALGTAKHKMVEMQASPAPKRCNCATGGISGRKLHDRWCAVFGEASPAQPRGEGAE